MGAEMIDWFQCVSTTVVIINHFSFEMRFNCILFVIAFVCGYVTVDSICTQDAFVGKYIDLVNVYFKYKQISVLTEFTCFSIGKLEYDFYLAD